MTSDPNIVLRAVGFSIGEGDLVQKAGCCIDMEFEDEYNRRSTRKITHPIGNASEDRAHLQAAHLALASVVRPMRKISVVELHCPTVVCDAMQEGRTPDSPAEANDDVIAEIRRWTTFYDKLRLVSCDADDLPGRQDAKQCAESQKSSDTNTVV